MAIILGLVIYLIISTVVYHYERKNWHLLLACALTLVLFVGGCSEKPGEYLVRVKNESEDAVEVKIGPADYGTVPAHSITPYNRVNGGDNQVLINGQTMEYTALFGIGVSGPHRWVFVVGPGGYWAIHSEEPDREAKK